MAKYVVGNILRAKSLEDRSYHSMILPVSGRCLSPYRDEDEDEDKPRPKVRGFLKKEEPSLYRLKRFLQRPKESRTLEIEISQAFHTGHEEGTVRCDRTSPHYVYELDQIRHSYCTTSSGRSVYIYQVRMDVNDPIDHKMIEKMIRDMRKTFTSGVSDILVEVPDVTDEEWAKIKPLYRRLPADTFRVYRHKKRKQK